MVLLIGNDQINKSAGKEAVGLEGCFEPEEGSVGLPVLNGVGASAGR